MIDLLKPDPDSLLAKWAPIINKTEHIFTWTNPLELSWLAEYATRCSNLIEIGSYNGRSAKVMLLANPKLHLVSLDTWDDGNLLLYKHNLGAEIAEGRVTFVQGRSQDSLHLFTTKDIFDGCFIDGGHEEHLVIADVQGVRPLMKPGSLMAGHDARGDNDVARGLKVVLPGFQNVCDSIWAYQL